MEAFSLLRYWRTNAGDATNNADVTTSSATTIVTAVSTLTSETEDDENDHGPFFDLEFSIPDEAGEDELVKNGETENGTDYGEEEEEDSEGSDELEDETDLKLNLVSGSSGDCAADVDASVSPSDDLFFKGSFVPVDQTAEIDLKPLQLQSRASLIKSATKLRVMMLKFKKSKLKLNSEITESNLKEEQKNDGEDENEDSGKSLAVKYKSEDIPIVSLFKRHNSSKAPKKQQNGNESVNASTEEKKFTKEAVQRYLRKVKPLYVRVSKRYGEKLKFTGQVASPASEEQKQSPVVNPAGLRVVCKHLRNSRSGFTAVAAASPGAVSSKRRDDSLLQQQDGIQSAILHCKRSFKASRDSDCSASDPAPAYGECENGSFCDAADDKETEEIKKR